MPADHYTFHLETNGHDYSGRVVLPGGGSREIVLSERGTLTGMVEHVVDRNIFRIRENWRLESDILSGYFFISGHKAGKRVTIKRYDPDRALLYLTGEMDMLRDTGEFEIASDEEIPVYISRLLSHCRLEEKLPKAQLNIRVKPLVLYPAGNPILIVSKEIVTNGQNINKNAGRETSTHLLELNERIDASGTVQKELKESEINRVLREVYRLPQGPIIIALINSQCNPLHERTISNLLTTAGYSSVFVSHRAGELLNVMHYADSSLVERFLQPVVGDYLEKLKKNFGRGSVITITCADPDD